MIVELISHRSTAGKLWESAQELMVHSINRLAATVNDEQGWDGDPGNQLVYLKCHAACSFHAETEAMLRRGFAQYQAHNEQHRLIYQEMRDLVKKTIHSDLSTSSVREASKSIVNQLRQHIDHYDDRLIAFCQAGKSSTDSSRRAEAYGPSHSPYGYLPQLHAH